jgi:hypothetical protein
MSSGLKRKTRGGGVDLLKKSLKDGGIKVGILLGTGTHPNSPDVLISEIAWWNEYGTSDGRIPARPFLRVAMRANKAKYLALEKKLIRAILSGQMTTDAAIGVLGLQAQTDVQDQITATKDPPNAPSTLAKKAPKTHPLIDSGQLRQHISWIGVDHA